MDAVQLEDFDLTLEQDETAQLEVQLRTLDTYYSEIAAAGSISRDQARALVQQCGLDMGPRYPLNSFTEIPSTTNLSVTMDSMFETSARLVIDLIKQAARLFIKLLMWVIELIKKHRATQASAAKTNERISLVKDAKRKMDATGIDQAEVPPSGEEAVGKVRETLERAEEGYQNAFNDLVADFVGDGEFLRFVQWLDINMLALSSTFAQKQELFYKVLLTPYRNPSATLIQIGELRTIALEIPSIEMRRRAESVTLKHAKPNFETVADIMRTMVEEARALRQAHEFEAPDAMTASDVINGNVNNLMSPLPMAPAETQRTVEGLLRATKDISTISPSPIATPELRQAFLEAQRRVNEEAMIMQHFWTILMIVSDTRDRFFNAMYERVMSDVALSRAMAQVTKDPLLFQKVQKILIDLSNNMRRV